MQDKWQIGQIWLRQNTQRPIRWDSLGPHSRQIVLLRNVRRHQRNRTLAIDVDFVWYFFTFWTSRKIWEAKLVWPPVFLFPPLIWSWPSINIHTASLTSIISSYLKGGRQEKTGLRCDIVTFSGAPPTMGWCHLWMTLIEIEVCLSFLLCMSYT